MKRILVLGKNGQIGFELCRCLAPLGDIVTIDSQQLDLSNSDHIISYINEVRPDIIVNAAAYTNVDKAEEEPELAMMINGRAPGILAEEAKKQGAMLIHYSTDYVFDGKKQTPYTEDDIPNPLNVYGETKWQGEKAIQEVGGHYLILRTSWVYGTRRKNFLLTILRLARERKELRIVDDQVGAPTWSRIIAQSTSDILVQLYSQYARNVSLSEISGVYHLSAAGHVSWHGFATAILEQNSRRNEHICIKLEPITSDQYVTAAKRPVWSILSNNKLHRYFDIHLPDWKEQLRLALCE